MSRVRDADALLETIETRTRRARLIAASPEYVYADLRDFAKKNSTKTGWLGSTDEPLELALLARGEPLIDVALAAFGLEARIVAELWKRTNQGAYKNALFRKGIRLGCLSNCLAPAAKFNYSVLGDEELKVVFESEEIDEQEAVLTNDAIGGQLLPALYTRKGAFANVSDDSWCRMIAQSSRNARINRNEETYDGPDMRLWDIHKGLFALLESAPVTGHWVVALHYLFDSVDPRNVANPESARIRAMLKRWNGVVVMGFKEGEIQSGYSTSLSMADEFRCLIAALYGRSYEDKTFTVLGSPTSEGVAERCAYYGNAKMTADEVRKYIEREKDVFVFAAVMNFGLLHTPQLRQMVEEAGSGQDFRYRYLRLLKHANSGRPSYNLKPISEWMLDDPEPVRPVVAEPATAETIAALDAKLAGMAKQLGILKTWIGWVLFIAVLSIIARYWK
jgi:hypothetical protein